MTYATIYPSIIQLFVGDGGLFQCPPKADSVKSEKPKARRYHKYMYTPAPPHPLYAEARRKEFVDSLSDAIDAFVVQCVEEAQRDDEQLYQQAMMEGANRENAIVNEALASLEEEVF